TNNVIYSGINVYSNLDDTGIFQTVGFGNHYLAENSPSRNVGTTNINPELAKALRERTTYPPLILTNDITLSTTLSPAVQRDTDTPDLGFEYEAIDYLMAAVTATSNAVLMVTNGTTIAFDLSSASFGLKLDAGANLISQGTPTRMNRFIRTHSVQEGASPPGASAANFATASPPVAGLAASFRFTDMPMLAGGYYHFHSEHAQWN